MTNETQTALERIGRRLTRTYSEIGGINRIGETELPSQARVEKILQGLLTLVFPGYFGGRISGRTSLETFVASHLDEIFVDLSEVVSRVLRFSAREGIHTRVPLPLPADEDGGAARDRDSDGAGREIDFEAIADELALKYLDRLPGIREQLRGDVNAAFEGDPAASGRDEIILCYPGTLAIAVYRLAHPLYEMGVPFIPRIMGEWAHARTGADIHPGAEIGPDFFIDHATGVVIGETTRIGRGVKIYQGVTLGALSFRKRPDGTLVKGGKRHPTLEDKVTIYANATILGGKTVIGRGAEIGGGCWVTRSVDPGARLMTHIHTTDGGVTA